MSTNNCGPLMKQTRDCIRPSNYTGIKGMLLSWIYRLRLPHSKSAGDDELAQCAWCVSRAGVKRLEPYGKRRKYHQVTVSLLAVTKSNRNKKCEVFQQEMAFMASLKYIRRSTTSAYVPHLLELRCIFHIEA